MLAHASRLPRSAFRAGGYQTIKTPFFSVRVKKNASGRARVGVVVSVAVNKSAVRRNFWKRQAKSAFLPHLSTPYDFILIFSPKVDTLTSRAFRKEFSKVIAAI